MHFSNLGDEAVTLTITTGTGPSTVTVQAGAGVSVGVNGGSSYLVEGAEGLYASVSFAAPGQLASYLVSPGANDEAPVTIYP